MSKSNKNTNFVKANVMNISEKFQLCPPHASEELVLGYVLPNFVFKLTLQPIKWKGVDKNYVFDREQLE